MTTTVDTDTEDVARQAVILGGSGPVSEQEQERAAAAVSECELQLLLSRENVRLACEILRGAIRGAEDAEATLGDATQRLDRMDAP